MSEAKVEHADLGPVITPAVAVAADDASEPAGWWDGFDRFLGRCSEHLNPILVKEARQALRSRQFTVTFMGLLAASWSWSFLGLSFFGATVDFSWSGPTMFAGYILILLFPLIILAPFWVFHSLAAERQDRTYELVSITTLNARQVLSGKMASVGLQIAIYLSAIFPCLAFTYLLRGIGIIEITVPVLYLSLLSLGLSVTGLLFASMVASRQRQIATTVLFVLVLFLVGFFCLIVWFNLESVFSEFLTLDTEEFWLFHGAMATAYFNTFALIFLAARSFLLGDMQNRSTALRVALVVAQISWLAWMSYPILHYGVEQALVFVLLSGAGWYIAGATMTGESSQLSSRVKRDLPQSLLGRIFLTWFAPGPGTGYMLALCGTTAACLAALLVMAAPILWPEAFPNVSHRLGRITLSGLGSQEVLLKFCVLGLSYLAIYLGLGKLVLRWLGSAQPVSVVGRFFVHALILVIGTFPVWVLQMTYNIGRQFNYYSILQISNPFWTLTEFFEKTTFPELPILLVLLPAGAIIVWLLNLPSLLQEIRQVRVAKPTRVVEEDQALHPVISLPKSPWD